MGNVPAVSEAAKIFRVFIWVWHTHNEQLWCLLPPSFTLSVSTLDPRPWT